MPYRRGAYGAEVTETGRAVWILLWGLAVLAVLALNIVVPVPSMQDGWPWTGGLMAFPIASVIVLLGRRGHPIGRMLALIATSAGIQFVLTWVTGLSPAAGWVGYADVVATVPAVGIFGGILGVLHLFPTGEPLNVVHRRALQALAAFLAAVGVLMLFVPGTMESTGRVNPLGIGPAWLGTFIDRAIVLLPLAGLAGIGVLLVRQRRAGPLERAQLRWFLLGAGTLTAMFMTFAFAFDAEGVLGALLGVLFLLGFWSLPAAIVVAIMRYRLYDIDRLLSRTVSYVIVAGVLSGVYALSVLALQGVLPVGGSQVAVAASTLGAAALFAPLRRTVQQRLEHRFDRARYEARMVAQDFGRRLQRELDPEVIEHDLAHVVTQTLHPADVVVWLR